MQGTIWVMKMRFKISALNVANFGTGIVLTLGVPTIYAKQIDAIVGDFRPNTEWELKLHRQKRSLSANAYFWKLADDLASVLKITKEEVYKRAIYHVGKFQVLEAKTEEIAQSFCNRWCMNGLGWYAYCDKEKPTTIYMYYGSSVYNSKEMSRLIDFVADECRRQGIETRPQWEVDAMLTEWDKRG